MLSLWNDEDAKHCRDALDLRVYTSRLLGGQPDLVLEGGGNTSVKLPADDDDRWQEILYIKGSGADLAQVTRSDFTPLQLGQIQRLIDLDGLDNAALMTALSACVIGAGGPRPSIETLLHAVLPFKFVEHTHADSVLALTNTENGASIVHEVYGALAPAVPFHPSGFELAKACHRVFQAHARSHTIGLILLNHGVFAFGQSARESYENMLHLVSLAENHLKRHAAWELPTAASEHAWSPQRIARLRAEISRRAASPLLLQVQDDSLSTAFARRSDLAELCAEGPATPQHAVFIKREPLLGEDVEAYAAAYAQQVANVYPETSLQGLGLDPAPRVVIDPALGVAVAGINLHYLGVASRIQRQSMEIMCRASGHDTYRGLPAKNMIDAEIHYGGFERRLLASGGEAVALLGEIALVTRVALPLGVAIVEALRARGCVVVTPNSAPPNPAATRVDWVLPEMDLGQEQALFELVRRFGGLDILVMLPGDGDWRNRCIELLKVAPRGGRVIQVGSPDDRAPPAQHCGVRHTSVQAGAAMDPTNTAALAQHIAALCQPTTAFHRPKEDAL